MKHLKGLQAPAARDGTIVAAVKAGTSTGRDGPSHCGTLAPTPLAHEPDAARGQEAGAAIGQEAERPDAAIGQEEATKNALQEFVIPTRYVVHSHHSGGTI